VVVKRELDTGIATGWRIPMYLNPDRLDMTDARQFVYISERYKWRCEICRHRAVSNHDNLYCSDDCAREGRPQSHECYECNNAVNTDFECEDRLYCEHCYAEYTGVCVDCGYARHNSNLRDTAAGHMVCDDCVGNGDYYACDHCSVLMYDTDNADPGRGYYCKPCVDNETAVCKSCDERKPNVHLCSGTHCRECIPAFQIRSRLPIGGLGLSDNGRSIFSNDWVAYKARYDVDRLVTRAERLAGEHMYMIEKAKEHRRNEAERNAWGMRCA